VLLIFEELNVKQIIIADKHHIVKVFFSEDQLKNLSLLIAITK